MSIKHTSEQNSQTGLWKRAGLFVSIIILLIVIADQWLKLWVKTNFYLGEDLQLTSWFHLKFIENNGFAFGIEWLNKYVLTFGRILAVIFFIWAMRKLMKTPGLRRGFLVAFALIIAGAAGNIFDCVFYGEIFNNPMPPEVASFLPAGGGYAGWFEGRVVDMLYFPLFSFTWPDWMPIVGGKNYEFFQYIFNIADSAITIGVLMMIFFYSHDASIAFNALFNKEEEKKRSQERA